MQDILFFNMAIKKSKLVFRYYSITCLTFSFSNLSSTTYKASQSVNISHVKDNLSYYTHTKNSSDIGICLVLYSDY